MSHERRTTGSGRTHESSQSDVTRSNISGSGPSSATDRSQHAAGAAEGSSGQQQLSRQDAPPLQLSSGRTSSKPPGGGPGSGSQQSNIRGKTTKSSGKDRHSKVNTARGPRDRRVRLSVSTAIQFYDIQDRLGFDQPSKAIEWLLKKAKPAIDELNQLPPTPLSIGPGQAAAAAAQQGTRALRRATTADQEKNSENSQAQQQTSAPEDSPQGLVQHGGTDHVELSELELVNRGSSRAKARERARERAKDTSSRGGGAAMGGELPHQEPSSSPSPVFASPGSVFDHVPGGGAPVCSSFTQLLQSPFPSFQSFLHSNTPQQNFMQSQLLQGLYHPPPLPPPITQPFLSSTFQRYGSGASQQQQQQEQDFMLQQHQHQSTGGEASEASGSHAFFPPEIHHKSSYSSQQPSFHSLPGSGSLPWTVSPAAQQQQHQASSNFYSFRSTLPPSGLYNYPQALLQQQESSSGTHRHLQSPAPAPAPAPFYLVPARIQGIGEEELHQQEQQQQQHQHKRPRQDE